MTKYKEISIGKVNCYARKLKFDIFENLTR